MSDRDLLLQEPTSVRWRVELRLALAGKRDHEVRALGSVEEYVERKLRDSADRSDAEGAFQVALSEEVSAWQVGRVAAPYYVRGLLQLICAFTPAAGFIKALDIMERFVAQEPGDVSESDLEISLIALTALSRFYPSPPPRSDEDPAYQNYVRMLYRLLPKRGLGPLALRQLLELRAAEIADEEISAIIVADAAMFEAAVDFAVLPPGGWSETQLSAVLSTCVSVQDSVLFDQFIRRIEWHDVPVIVEDEHILVVPYDGLKVYIRPDKQLAEGYALLKWERYSKDGFEKFELYSSGEIEEWVETANDARPESNSRLRWRRGPHSRRRRSSA